VDGPRSTRRNDRGKPMFIGALARPGQRPDDLLVLVANATLDDHIAAPVFGIVCSVLRDPAQSEEVTHEVLVEVWRIAARFRLDKVTALAWVLTIAHLRAVDRVRSAQATADREYKAALLEQTPAYDEVSEAVERSLEDEHVRRCLQALTQTQRESVVLAYYRGLTCPQVGELLSVPLGTVKSRMRDGLIRMHECLGVTA